ncbi:MAG: 50S ribosomal protein L25 [Chloroflexota bacterium]|nr:MAG: 50S ribosomal protein L25 [Chloroflexota bacterium]
MQQLELEATPRRVVGKKVRHLRRAGITPLNLYGKGMSSVPLQAPTKGLEQIVGQAGHTRLINLTYNGKKALVLARQAQRNVRTHHLLHVDLYAVSLTEKMRIGVPVALFGEAPAVQTYDAVLVHTLAELEIEALATDIPQTIEVDLSPLKEIDDAIHVRDIVAPPGVAILSDPSEVIAKAAAPTVVEEEREEAAEEAAAAAAPPPAVETAEEE